MVVVNSTQINCTQVQNDGVPRGTTREGIQIGFAEMKKYHRQTWFRTSALCLPKDAQWSR